MHLPPSKRGAWSHEVRNFTHEMFYCCSDLSHPGGGSTASGTSSEGARAAGGNFVLRTAQRRRWTTAGAMLLFLSCGQPSVAAGPRQVHCTCRYPSAELGRTKCEIPHNSFLTAIRRIELVQVRCTCRYPSAELGRTKCEIPHNSFLTAIRRIG